MGCAFALTQANSASAAGVFQNGSFEEGNPMFDANGWSSQPVNSIVITGWEVYSAALAVGQSGNNASIPPSDGNRFLDLTSYLDNAPYGGVRQEFLTSPGQSYVVTLDLGVSAENPAFNGPVSIDANVNAGGGVSRTFTLAPETSGSSWSTYNFQFLATDASTILSIVGTQAHGGAYIGLDNVTLAAVPEPYQYSLIGVTGLLGLAGWTRLRRKAA